MSSLIRACYGLRSLLFRHSRFTSDKARNTAFYNALRQAIKPGMSVLDIGSGTGVWAISSALLGATKVVAIERETGLLPVIKQLAKENGVDSKITIIGGDSRKIQLNDKFDVIVSETIPNIDQDMTDLFFSVMIDARERFLKQNGALIPSTMSIWAAPALVKFIKPFDIGISSVNYDYIKNLLYNYPLDTTSDFKIIGKPSKLTEYDLFKQTIPPDYLQLKSAWNINDSGGLNSIIFWTESKMGKGLRFSTIDCNYWVKPFVALKKFKAKKGKLVMECGISEMLTWCNISMNSSKGSEIQNYSPLFSLTQQLINDIQNIPSDQV